jgi:hypothetical protein
MVKGYGSAGEYQGRRSIPGRLHGSAVNPGAMENIDYGDGDGRALQSVAAVAPWAKSVYIGPE